MTICPLIHKDLVFLKIGSKIKSDGSTTSASTSRATKRSKGYECFDLDHGEEREEDRRLGR